MKNLNASITLNPKKIVSVTSMVMIAVVLVLSIRGNMGNPSIDTLNTQFWKESGPFELSPERGRFALMYSIVEDGTFHFSLPVARFATPDLGFKDGNYVSLFPPGLSFIVIPGYLLGKIFNAGQIGAFSVIALIGFMNAVLVRKLSLKLGAGEYASNVASLLFIFATPAFAYAVSLYQHHLTVFLLLVSVLFLLETPSFKSTLILWFLCGLSILIDFSNIFLFFPVGLYALSRVISLSVNNSVLTLKLRSTFLLTLAGMLLPLYLFLSFNKASYNSHFQLGGTVPGVQAIDENGLPTTPATFSPEQVDQFINPEKQAKSALSFFNTRDILNGLYVHFLSPDRGMLYFAPVMLFGFLGLFALRSINKETHVIFSVLVVTNVLVYSLWGDPWGGWAFGSRYLIPSYALLSAASALWLSMIAGKRVLVLIFTGILVYSAFVNTAGALSSNANPPEVEVLILEKQSGKEEKYTYERNLDFLSAGDSKSAIYRAAASDKVSAWTYFLIVLGLASIPLVVNSAMLFRRNTENEV